MSRIVRRAALICALLILAAAPIQRAHALTITVDGDPSDWPPATLIISDGNDVPGPDNRDIGAVHFTNNTTTLFFRIDTVAPVTLRTNGLMWIALDTRSGGANDPLFGPNGTDYVFEISGTGLTRLFWDCTSGTCVSVALPPSYQVGNTGNNATTEFAIAAAAVEVTGATTSIGIAAFFDTPSGTDAAPNAGFFTSAIPGPLPVTLTAFSAERVGDDVAIRWSTSSEIGVSGYHVLRSATGRRADATPITATPISATGSSVTGDSYSVGDAGAASAGYSYWLQVIGADQQVDEEYGPVRAAGELTGATRVYLPLVRR